MTGPAFGGTERGTGAPSRATGTQGAVGAILIVLALGLALRLIIAYLLPGSGFKVDLGAFRFWAGELAAHGAVGLLRPRLPPRLHARATCTSCGSSGIVGDGRGRRRRPDQDPADPRRPRRSGGSSTRWSRSSAGGGASRSAALSWPSSTRSAGSTASSWGQVDSFGVVFLLLGLRELWRDRPERAAIYTVIAAMIKPQLGILVPLVAVVTIRRALWPAGGERRPGAHRPAEDDPDDGPGRPRDGRRHVDPVRTDPDRVLPPAVLDRRHVPVHHRQRLQPVGARPLATSATARPRPAGGSATRPPRS